MNILTKANYQQVAKATVGAPNFVDDNMYIELVKSTGKALGNLDTNAKLAIEAAYVFSRKVPLDERQDLFQELVIAILEAGTENPAFAYTIARRDWQDFWRSYKVRNHFYGGYLSDVILNSDGEETELAELLVGEVEFERKQIDKLDAESLWQRIPADIQQLVTKRLLGKPLGAPRKRKSGRPKNSGSLNDTERQRLNRYVRTEGYKLLVN